MIKTRWLTAAAVAACASALAACGSSGSGTNSASSGSAGSGGATKAPIKVGNISSLTGPNTLPDFSRGANAYFSHLNATGGIDGRKVDFIVGDDQGNPQTMAQVGSRLINQDGAVAMVGNSSIAECAVNAKLYQQTNTLSIAPLGVAAQCFSAPNIAPANQGPARTITMVLYYAAKKLHLTRMCVVSPSLPGAAASETQGVNDFEKLTGLKLAYDNDTLDLTADPTPAIIKARDAGCQAATTTGPEVWEATMINAIHAQHATGIRWIFPTIAYTDQLLKAVGTNADGMLFSSEFLPYTESDPALDQPRQILEAAHVPLSEQTLGGYLAAQIFTTVSRTIKGPITRDSVTKAFKTMSPYRTPLMGAPYVFGPGQAHNPNNASKFVTVVDGHYKLVSNAWYRVPTP